MNYRTKNLSGHAPEEGAVSRQQYRDQSDLFVWRSFKSGNESAFIYIYESYFEALYNYAFRFCSDENLIKDVVQDLFIYIRNKRNGLGDTSNIKCYLFKALKRRILRENRSWHYRLLGLEGEYSFTFILSHEQQLVDRQFNEELLKRLNQTVQQLSTRQREVIYYFYYEGMTYSQIREIIGLSNIKSVRNILYKALDFLRARLDDLYLPGL